MTDPTDALADLRLREHRIEALEAEKKAACDHGVTTVCWRCVNAEKVKAYQAKAEAAEAQLQAHQDRIVELEAVIAEQDHFESEYAKLRREFEAHQDRVQAVIEALKDFVEDTEARWDMSSPSTNPGIVHCVERGKAALAQLTAADAGDTQ